MSISKTILDYVLEHNEGVLTTNAKEDVRFDPTASILQLDVREAICVPMQARDDIDLVRKVADRFLTRSGEKHERAAHLHLIAARQVVLVDAPAVDECTVGAIEIAQQAGVAGGFDFGVTP